MYDKIRNLSQSYYRYKFDKIQIFFKIHRVIKNTLLDYRCYYKLLLLLLIKYCDLILLYIL